jgi:hypothetical protein
MKLAAGILWISLALGAYGFAQTNGSSSLHTVADSTATSFSDGFAVMDATSTQESTLRAQIRFMHPQVLPLRVVFVPHWKYLYTARVFHLHIPAGYQARMFTHLPSRSIFIDNDRYLGEDWLGHWIAHELGHLATNSTKEEDAERAAHELRKRLKDPGQKDAR